MAQALPFIMAATSVAGTAAQINQATRGPTPVGSGGGGAGGGGDLMSSIEKSSKLLKDVFGKKGSTGESAQGSPLGSSSGISLSQPPNSGSYFKKGNEVEDILSFLEKTRRY